MLFSVWSYVIVVRCSTLCLFCDGGEFGDLVPPLANIGCFLYSWKPPFLYFSWWSFECFPSQANKKIDQVLLLLNISLCIAHVFNLLLFASILISTLTIFLIWSCRKEM